MSEAQSETPTRIAYREAGHAVMSYLIRGGFTDKFVPVDRSLILPPFQRVAIQGSTADWGAITKGLGSLLTAPQVLIAGLAVDQIRGAEVTPDTLRASKDAQRAFDLFGSYIEEYGQDDMRDRDREAWEWVDEIFPYVVNLLQTYWVAVEALAQTLLEQTGLSEARAFEIIEQAIPVNVREQAKARVEKDARELTQNVLKMIREAEQEVRKRQASKPQLAPKSEPKPIAKRKWWEFWK